MDRIRRSVRASAHRQSRRRQTGAAGGGPGRRHQSGPLPHGRRVAGPSVILRKLAAAGAGNVLSRALRALGRIERTLFTLQWLSDPALRQRSHAGLNKGEASNALRRAVFFHRQGEIRDRTFENQSFRASGLSLITAAIIHWNTVYLDRAVRQLRAQGADIPDDLLAHVAPLGWEHIGLTGDYVWTEANPAAPFRPLREVRSMFQPQAA
jgi:hypothetical protein